MGAVTALMYVDKDPTVAGMVLDSPFSNLRVLAEELTKSMTGIPSFLISGGLSFIRSTIRNEARFDIDDVSPIDNVGKCFVPALFLTGKSDTFVLPHHTRELHAKYAGDKTIMEVEGDHNSGRPRYAEDSITIFFHNTLRLEELSKIPAVQSEPIPFYGGLAGRDVPRPVGWGDGASASKIGNEREVRGIFGGVDVDPEEEELRIALALSAQEYNQRNGKSARSEEKKE
jgi:hypothetical protein